MSIIGTGGIYIDEIVVYTDSGAYFSGTNHLGAAGSLHGDIATDEGLKWFVQIVNGTGSTITFHPVSNPLVLNICTNHKDNEGGSSDHDAYYCIGSGSLAPNASIYIGHDLFSSYASTTQTHNTTSVSPTFDNTTENTISSTTHLLSDQYDGTGDLIAASRFKLFLGWGTLVDIAGKNTHTGSGAHANSFGSFFATNNVALMRRKAIGSNSIPSTTYVETDWQITPQSSATISEQDYLTASVAGDPHIKTLTGECYEFDYLGAFRMFEYSKNGASIIINGLAETGPGRWKTKQYIRKLFIQNNDTNILLDMGFRGSPVKVLENNGIAYKEKTLSFNKLAKRYNFDNTKSTLDLDEPITDDLPGLIRNQLDIILEIDNNTEKTPTEKTELGFITLQNVNEYNLQPCRLEINMSRKLIEHATGCLIDRKYATVSKLNKITDITPLVEPTLEDLKNIPELEIEPKKRNLMWK